MTDGHDHFVTFDSWEDMQAHLRESERLANEAVKPRQRDITWGSYCFRIANGSIPVFTYIFTQAEASVGEDAETVRGLHERYDRGYRYGMHHSFLEHDGELGDLHIATAWPITKEEFEHARKQNFRLGLGDETFASMLRRIQEEAIAPVGPVSDLGNVQMCVVEDDDA